MNMLSETNIDFDKSSVSSRVALYNEHLAQQSELQNFNPFNHFNVSQITKRLFSKDEYGRAPSGSRSEARSLEAKVQLWQDILQLCQLLHEKSFVDTCTDCLCMKFGELFQLYDNISDKLVGTLLRARKYKYVDFDGEMLFQGRDNKVTIRLAQKFEDIKQEVHHIIEKLKAQLKKHGSKDKE